MRQCLRLLRIFSVTIVLLTASLSVHAEPVPLVFVLDASLSEADLQTADKTIMDISRGIADGTIISLIVFDDVVQRVVPLQRVGAGHLADFENTLAGIKSSVSSNLAAGFERGLDELNDQPAASLLVFARAAIDGADEERKVRYRKWLVQLLLPDANDRSVAITLVAPEAGADAGILAEVLSYSGNSSLVLSADSGLTAQLLELIEPRSASIETAAADELTSAPTDAAAVSVPSTGTELANAPASDTTSATSSSTTLASDSNSATASSTTLTSDSTASSSTALTSDSTAASDPTTAATTGLTTGASVGSNANPEADLSAGNGPGSLVRYAWYGAMLLLLIMIGVMIVSALRSRKAQKTQAKLPAVEVGTGNTSSYLPLNASRSRHFGTGIAPAKATTAVAGVAAAGAQTVATADTDGKEQVDSLSDATVDHASSAISDDVTVVAADAVPSGGFDTEEELDELERLKNITARRHSLDD